VPTVRLAAVIGVVAKLSVDLWTITLVAPTGSVQLRITLVLVVTVARSAVGAAGAATVTWTTLEAAEATVPFMANILKKPVSPTVKG
jgi:hypothetical protein